MNKYWSVVIVNIPALICYVAAFGLAYSSLSGWGWFLFIGLLISHTYSKGKKEEEVND